VRWLGIQRSVMYSGWISRNGYKMAPFLFLYLCTYEIKMAGFGATLLLFRPRFSPRTLNSNQLLTISEYPLVKCYRQPKTTRPLSGVPSYVSSPSRSFRCPSRFRHHLSNYPSLCIEFTYNGCPDPALLFQILS